jgi:hypothetical protein
MKVKATAAGFYLSRRNAGEEFDIPYQLFATEWMESLEPKDQKAAHPAAPAVPAPLHVEPVPHAAVAPHPAIPLAPTTVAPPVAPVVATTKV